LGALGDEGKAGAAPGERVAEEKEEPEAADGSGDGAVRAPAHGQAGCSDGGGTQDGAQQVGDGPADEDRRPPYGQGAEPADDAGGQVAAQPDGRADGGGGEVHAQQPGDGELGVAARPGDGRSQDVNEQQREDHRLDDDVGQRERLAGDVAQVAAGQHGHVDEAAGAGGRGGDRGHRAAAFWVPAGAACAAREGRPVRAKNTSSSDGWRIPASSTVMPAWSRARTMAVASPGAAATPARRRRPSALRLTGPVTKGASTVAAAGSGRVRLTSMRAPPIRDLSERAVPPAMTRPWAMTRIWSGSWSASSRYWVVSSRVAPSATRSRMTAHMAWRLAGSSPVVGSSRNSTGGRVTIPAARSRRRRMPPEKPLST